jgi:hypothetical protein
LAVAGSSCARQILTGPAIQARCLECPATPRAMAPRERASLGAWLKGLLPLG